MSPIKHFFKNTLRKKKVYIPTLIVLIGLGWYFFSSSSSGKEEIITVQPATFVQEVSVTGKVVPAKDVDMGFEASGRVASLSVKIGDTVKTGQLLAGLSAGDQWAVVMQRQAKVDSETAKLAEVQRGSRQEDIDIATTEAEGAEITARQSLQTLVDQIRDSYSKSDDAVRGKADQLFKNPRTVNPEVLAFDNYTLRQTVNDERVRVGEILASWSTSLGSLSVDTYADTYISDARTNLSYVRNFFNNLGAGVSALTASDALPQVTIDKYRTDVSSARTSIGTSISSLGTAEQTYKSSVNALKKAREQLALKKAGSTQEQIASQLSILRSAQADLQSARALYGKTTIVAPFDGLVTKVDVKEGEIVSSNTNAISMISSSAYELDSFISESDISKVRVGQPARVTLDAYGKDIIFTASVVQVDPAETTVDGVSTYKTELQFTTNDERIRSGMTANITIQTAEKPASVVIPQEALFLDAGEKVVTVDQAGTRVNKKVVTGGINSDGDIEVLSGISIGDRVVIKK